MFYVIRSLNTPAYFSTAGRTIWPLRVSTLDAATHFGSLEEAIEEIISTVHRNASAATAMGQVTVVKVEEVLSPVYREVTL